MILELAITKSLRIRKAIALLNMEMG